MKLPNSVNLTERIIIIRTCRKISRRLNLICQFVHYGFLDVEVEGEKKHIRITRAHMEEDAGKLVHHGNSITDSDYSLVDYNRTGTPLLEIVSEPDMRSAKEAVAYMEKLRAILQYVEISDCRMEEGSLRCDANVSVRPIGQKELGTKRKLKISTLSEVLKGLLNMKRFVRRNFWKKAGRLFRKQEHGMKKKV